MREKKVQDPLNSATPVVQIMPNNKKHTGWKYFKVVRFTNGMVVVRFPGDSPSNRKMRKSNGNPAFPKKMLQNFKTLLGGSSQLVSG